MRFQRALSNTENFFIQSGKARLMFDSHCFCVLLASSCAQTLIWWGRGSEISFCETYKRKAPKFPARNLIDKTNWFNTSAQNFLYAFDDKKIVGYDALIITCICLIQNHSRTIKWISWPIVNVMNFCVQVIININVLLSRYTELILKTSILCFANAEESRDLHNLRCPILVNSFTKSLLPLRYSFKSRKDSGIEKPYW